MLLFKKYSLSVYEQMLISAMNFLIVFTSAYFLTGDDFSVFVVVFSLATVGYLVNLSLFGLPTLVIISEKIPVLRIEYLKSVQSASFLFLVFVNASVVLIFYSISSVSLLLSCACVFFGVAWGLYETIRKSLYASLNSKDAFLMSLLVFLMFSLINIFVYLSGMKVSVGFLMLIYGLNYSLGILFYYFKFRTCLKIGNIKPIFFDHYDYAKLHMVGVVLFWLCSSGLFVLVSYVTPAAELGKARVIQNMMGVFTSIIQVFENNFVPKAASVFRVDGHEALRRYLIDFFKRLSLWYMVFVSVGGVFFYGVYYIVYYDKFGDGWFGVVLFTIQQFLAFVVFFIATYFRVLRLNNVIFYAHFVCSVFVVSIGVLLAKLFGYVGISASFLLCTLITVMVYLFFLKFNLKKEIQ